jgi:methionyl-tRNA formyltransferase
MVAARIAFFGTPPIAATCLQALLHGSGDVADVVLVVCQPDKPQGRGQQLQAPPTKLLAQQHQLAVAQPTTLKRGTEDGDAFFAHLQSLHVDMAIVVAYGRIIPTRVLDLPPRGFVNVHASLLPRWRGAAPVQRAIEAGDHETGVCLMHMTPGLDEGDVYATATTPILNDDDSAGLLARLADLGGALLVHELRALLQGTLPRVPQANEGVCYAHMLKKEEAHIHFDRPASAVSCHVRAMQPWPGAQAMWGSDVLKLFSPTVVSTAGNEGAPGTVLASVPSQLHVACASGVVSFAEVQMPNKKRMAVDELRRGRSLAAGVVLT